MLLLLITSLNSFYTVFPLHCIAVPGSGMGAAERLPMETVDVHIGGCIRKPRDAAMGPSSRVPA